LESHRLQTPIEASVDFLPRIDAFCTLEQIRSIRPIWEKLQAENWSCTDIEADFERYISVIDTERCQPYVLLVYRDGAAAAMLIGVREAAAIHCKLGYMTVLKPSLRCLTITHGGYLGDFGEQTCRQVLHYLSARLHDGQFDVVRFKQVPVDGLLYSLARKQSSIVCRRHFPKVDRHWRMNVPDQIDSFYARHSSKTNQTLKRQLRQLDKKNQTRLVECRDADTLQQILPDAAAVSARTYQRALGWGLSDDADTRQQLLTAARHGWLCLHVLYLDDTPCAFQLGLRSRQTYYLQSMGFDPALKQWHLGTVLFLKILEQLCQDPRIDCLDFGFGDAEYKRRFGSEYWDESTVYVFARRVYPLLINLIYTAVSDTSEAMRFLAKKFGLEGKIKQTWRHLLPRKRQLNPM
jgi:hypothetical protein